MIPSEKKQISVKLLRYKCIGCSYCISVAPDLFSISSADGKVTSINNKSCDSDVSSFTTALIYADQVEQSARICPVNAIVPL